MFKNIKLNDTVFSVKYGWGKCYTKSGNVFEIVYTLKCDKGTGTYNKFVWYFENGKQTESDIIQEIFWDVPKIIAPTRKIKRCLIVFKDPVTAKFDFFISDNKEEFEKTILRLKPSYKFISPILEFESEI